MNASIVIGIHGLANKAPSGEKLQWWRDALVQRLQRNCGKTNNSLPFDFVYWADLRYAPPVSPPNNPAPYHRDDGTGPFPIYHRHKWDAVFGKVVDLVGEKIDWLEMRTAVSTLDDLEHLTKLLERRCRLYGKASHLRCALVPGPSSPAALAGTAKGWSTADR